MLVLKSFLQFIFVLSVIPLSYVHSRTLEGLPKTTVFDASAARQRAIDLLSFNSETLFQSQLSEDNISPLTIKLHSGAALHASLFKTYKDLALSRIHHDSNRLKFIFNKLAKIKNPHAKPTDIEAPVTSAPDGSEYYARFGFGTPPQQLFTTIDTGSDITWIQCKPCDKCYKQRDRIFDPLKSSSYKEVSCDSEICGDQSCDDENVCQYVVNYGDGSYTTGDYAEETLTLGKNKVDNVIGCGHDNEGLFNDMDGLFGLGRGSLSFPSQVNKTSFSYCLVDKDSTDASLLEFGTSATRDSITAPLLSIGNSFYYLGLTGVSVAGKRLPVSPSTFEIDESGDGGVILDSGTTITYFPEEVYNILSSAFVKAATSLKPAESVEGLKCFDLSSLDSIEVPTIDLHFGSNKVTLEGKNSLILNEENNFCFAFTTSSSRLSIIGNTQQQGFRITYDTTSEVVGFEPNKC